MSIDLHTHSTFSDGTFDPDQLVRLAWAKGLAALGITDHDTIEGLPMALHSGADIGLEVIPGLELSARHHGEPLHILGYCIDPQQPDLQTALTQLQQGRKERNLNIVKKLNRCGIDISLDEVERKSRVGQTGRPHFAQVLVAKGVVKNLDEAFRKYLRKGASAYVSRFVYDAEQSIALIRQAGGVSVLAHPATVDSTLRKIPALLEELALVGLDGVECYYPTHNARMRKTLLNLAKHYRLIVTGGSDYHGDIRPGTTLAGGKNVHVPLTVLETLKERVEHIRSRC